MPGGLVDQQDARPAARSLHAARATAPAAQASVAAACPSEDGCSCAAIASRRNAISSSGSSVVEKPAARRCPPPPWARAITDTSTSSSVARSETLCWPLRSPLRELAHERRDLRALQRAQLVDDALGVALLGVGALEVLGAERRERQLAGVEALQLPERERRAARACPAACPRTAGGRRPARRRRPRSARPPSGARAGRCSRT